jgi:hypothetical protein
MATTTTTTTTTTTSKKDQLASRIAHLKLHLAPLVPLPTGNPHPDFPQTLLNYHMLTEDQLDSIASYYHQSTPSIWTHQYPACMNWDKEMLAKRRQASVVHQLGRGSQGGENTQWMEALLVAEKSEEMAKTTVFAPRRTSVQFAEGFSDVERLAIKRRKFGKFIGLMDCETPIDEIEGRMRASMEMAIKLARDELRLAEEWEFRWRKMA